MNNRDIPHEHPGFSGICRGHPLAGIVLMAIMGISLWQAGGGMTPEKVAINDAQDRKTRTANVKKNQWFSMPMASYGNIVVSLVMDRWNHGWNMRFEILEPEILEKLSNEKSSLFYFNTLIPSNYWCTLSLLCKGSEG